MARQYYVYIPYTAQETREELVEGARGWRTTYARANEGLTDPAVWAKRPIVLLHGENAPLGVLANLEPEDYVLYVMSHCNIGRTTVSNTRLINVSNRVELTAQTLANRMIADGLPRTVRHLKLYACYGGYQSDTPGSVLDSFGARLYWSLVTRGCDRVQLSAYTVPLNAVVDPATGHKRTSAGDRPSNHRRRWPH